MDLPLNTRGDLARDLFFQPKRSQFNFKMMKGVLVGNHHRSPGRVVRVHDLSRKEVAGNILNRDDGFHVVGRRGGTVT